MEEERGSRCPTVRAQLSAYLEEELDGGDRARVEEHLADCESCRVDLELLRHTLGTLRSLPEVPAPAAILQGVREGTAPKGLRRRLAGLLGGRPAVGIPLGAAATLLVAFGVFLVAERFPDLGKPRPPEMSRSDAGPEAVGTGDDISVAGKVLPEPRQVEKAKDYRPRPSVAGPGPPRLAEELSTLDPDVGGLSREAAPASAPRPEIPEEPTLEAPLEPPAAALEEKAVSGREETTAAEGPPATLEKESDAFFDTPALPGPLEKRLEKEAEEASPEISGAKGRRMLYRKSLPPRDRAETRQFAAPRAALQLSTEGAAGAGEDQAVQEQTEVLTIVSSVGDELRQLRESLAQTGGILLEMKNLDTTASQQVALPHQARIPRYQDISRGWQVRASVPLHQVEAFIASLEHQSSFQLLERVTVPASWASRPGSQNVEINLVR